MKNGGGVTEYDGLKARIQRAGCLWKGWTWGTGTVVWGGNRRSRHYKLYWEFVSKSGPSGMFFLHVRALAKCTHPGRVSLKPQRLKSVPFLHKERVPGLGPAELC